MSRFAHTTRFTRRKLPHWEVQGGRYFVTVRCADSLPNNVVNRLREIHESLSLVEPHSEDFAALQRTYFLTMERFLDAGHGCCPLAVPAAAQIVVDELQGLDAWQIAVPHFTIMPNHWHALLIPRSECPKSLGEIMRRVKGRSARSINSVLGRSGTLWQAEWFDRWMRDDTEFEKCARYIQQNPVKAGLVREYRLHSGTR